MVHAPPRNADIELNVSYVYTALWTYFDRDNVGLPGLAAWFKKESDEVRWAALGWRVRLAG